MEKLVLSLCGLWFWLTRKYRTSLYSQAAVTLNSARNYLSSNFGSQASTRDRGFLLAHQAEALSILEHHAAQVDKTVHRFDSLTECCRYVEEELTPAPAAVLDSTPLPQRVVFAPIIPSASTAQPATPLASFAAFWSSEGSGIVSQQSAMFSHSTIVRAFTRGGESLAPIPSNSINSRIS